LATPGVQGIVPGDSLGVCLAVEILVFAMNLLAAKVAPCGSGRDRAGDSKRVPLYASGLWRLGETAALDEKRRSAWEAAFPTN
jgi:hypothetical protein